MYRKDILERRKEYNEYNDCTVRAWAEAFNCPYERAHKYLESHGREHRKGMLHKDIASAFKNVVSFHVEELPYSRGNKVSITEFIKRHSTGTYYILVRDHALCIKDGMVYDDVRMTNRRQVIKAWKIDERRK